MKTLMLSIIMLLFTSAIVLAEPVTFTWNKNTDTYTTGYEIYMNSGSEKISDIPDVNTESINVDVDMQGKCNAFYIIAIGESNSSRIISSPSHIEI